MIQGWISPFLHFADQSLATEYDNRLQESLQDLRRHYDEQAAALKSQLEDMYETKITGMQDQLNRSQSEDQGMQEELSTGKLKIGELSSQVNSLTVSLALSGEISDYHW